MSRISAELDRQVREASKHRCCYCLTPQSLVSPHWKLVEQSGRWKFKALANDPSTVLLKQFATTFDVETGKETTEKTRLNEWILLKGAETENLPYGQSIRSYSVDVGKFSSIK